MGWVGRSCLAMLLASRSSRAIASVVAAILLAGFVLVSPAFAYYAGTCGASDHLIEYLLYDASGNSVTAGGGTVSDLVPVASCTGSSAGNSFVLPANIQGTGFCAAQVGYGTIQTGALDWIYTPTDSNCSVLYPSGSHTRPVLHHSYSFRTLYDSRSTDWDYTVTDNTISSSQTWSGYASATHGYKGWAGLEVYNSQSQFGGPGAGSAAYIHDPYLTYGGTQHYFTSTTKHALYGTLQTYWHVGSAVQSNGHVEIWGYTDNR